jgi:hypothetical protein
MLPVAAHRCACTSGHAHFTLCNIYLPPAVLARQAEPANLLSHLALPHIFLGDFNASHIILNGNFIDGGGTLVYNVCADFDLILLNTSAHMHLRLPWTLPLQSMYSSPL